MDAPQPVEAYGRSKLEAERVVRSYASWIPSTIIRPCSVYGPRDVDFLQAFRQVSHGWGIYPGCRDRYLSLIFVGDLVNGIVQAAQTPAAAGRTYFLCADRPLSWRDLYRAMAGVMGTRIVELNIPQWAIDWAGRAGDVYSRLSGRYSLANSQKIALSRPRYWVCSSERAREDLRFAARVSLPEGLEATYRWYVEHGWLGQQRWRLAGAQPTASQAR
jgi:nucleoside-diphosphate-sugar epimerase